MQTATRSRAQLIASFLCALVAVTSPTTRNRQTGAGEWVSGDQFFRQAKLAA